VANGDAKLEKVFKRWREAINSEGLRTVDFLCYLIDHQYTEANLRLSKLKGRDLALVQQAARVARNSGFTVYLATLEHMVMGSCEEDAWRCQNHDIDEVIESELKLRKAVNLEGDQIAAEIDLEESHVVDYEIIKDDEPNDEDFSAFTGNEGATTTHWYRRVVRLSILDCV